MKKIIIIGSGVAGISAGIYARLKGYKTVIYEMHSTCGGECTGWDRKGFHFDGCIHWLIGSKPGTNMNKLWNKVGALLMILSILSVMTSLHALTSVGTK